MWCRVAVGLLAALIVRTATPHLHGFRLFLLDIAVAFPFIVGFLKGIANIIWCQDALAVALTAQAV